MNRSKADDLRTATNGPDPQVRKHRQSQSEAPWLQDWLAVMVSQQRWATVPQVTRDQPELRTPGPGRATLRLTALAACMATLVACSAPAAAPVPALPAFPAYKPSPPESERIYMMAAIRGRLVQRGRCLGIAPFQGGRFTTIIWPETAVLGRDPRGLYVIDRPSGAVLRPGDRFIGGGGELPPASADNIDDELSQPVPDECRDRLFSLSPEFQPEHAASRPNRADGWRRVNFAPCCALAVPPDATVRRPTNVIDSALLVVTFQGLELSLDYGSMASGVPEREDQRGWSEGTLIIDGRVARFVRHRLPDGGRAFAADMLVRHKRDPTTGAVAAVASLGIRARCAASADCAVAEKIARSITLRAP